MKSIAGMIDHAALAPDTTQAHVRQLCMEAELYGFAAVCVMPFWVPLACCTLDELGSSIPVCTVVGFPNGAHQPEIKVAEARKALADGAKELDMVINVGALRSGQEQDVLVDIAAVVETAHEAQALVKVILETALLSDAEKRRACELAIQAEADFVKTSTGFVSGGATVHDVELIRSILPKRIQVKASGGIRTIETAREMISAGATRIGTSSGVAIVTTDIEENAVGTQEWVQRR